jgi:nicotinate phosphoribosyltransferase
MFGIGTNLVTGHPDSYLDGVYKLACVDGKPRIKLSENFSKITLPHKKQVYRIVDNDGKFVGADAVAIADEHYIDIMYHPLYPLKSFSLNNSIKETVLHKVMEKGERKDSPRTLREIAHYSLDQLGRLPEEYKRFDNPHVYKVGISKRLQTERDRLMKEYKK